MDIMSGLCIQSKTFYELITYFKFLYTCCVWLTISIVLELSGRDFDDSDPCVFTDVLLPLQTLGSATEHENSLQFEVHYRETTKKTLMTFLFNHSRILMIIDYLLETYNFIMCRTFNNDTSKD